VETGADDARVDSPVARQDEGVTTVSSVAYGFMGSQALFAALELGLFTELHAGPAPLLELARRLACEPRALLAVLEACVPCPMRALSR
jgi:Dimerisation domain